MVTVPFTKILKVINKDTPYKLAEIIRDTWPQLYYLKDFKKDKKNGSINNSTTKEGMV